LLVESQSQAPELIDTKLTSPESQSSFDSYAPPSSQEGTSLGEPSYTLSDVAIDALKVESCTNLSQEGPAELSFNSPTNSPVELSSPVRELDTPILQNDSTLEPSQLDSAVQSQLSKLASSTHFQDQSSSAPNLAKPSEPSGLEGLVVKPSVSDSITKKANELSASLTPQTPLETPTESLSENLSKPFVAKRPLSSLNTPISPQEDEPQNSGAVSNLPFDDLALGSFSNLTDNESSASHHDEALSSASGQAPIELECQVKPTKKPRQSRTQRSKGTKATSVTPEAAPPKVKLSSTSLSKIGDEPENLIEPEKLTRKAKAKAAPKENIAAKPTPKGRRAKISRSVPPMPEELPKAQEKGLSSSTLNFNEPTLDAAAALEGANEFNSQEGLSISPNIEIQSEIAPIKRRGRPKRRLIAEEGHSAATSSAPLLSQEGALPAAFGESELEPTENPAPPKPKASRRPKKEK
jgi:hypothetical protein